MTTAASLVLETARRGELHHAIILHGPAATALRELAITIAKTLECTNGTTGDDCLVCQRIDRRTHPDVHFIEVTGDRKMISIEQIRNLVDAATMRPYEGRNKVFIIDPADALSVSGSNALLKTLEEPARDTTFVLLTRSPDLLLQTITSRSQKIYVGGEVANAEWQEQLSSFAVDALHRFATRNDSAALLALAATVADQEEVKDAMAVVANILCGAIAPHDGKLAAVRDAIGNDRLLAAADQMMAAIRVMTVNADARLVVEQAMAHLVVSPC